MTKREHDHTFQDQANDLFLDFFEDQKNWSSHRQMIKQVFNALPASALTAEHIANISHAINQFSNKPDFSSSLKALVRAKVLRSRMKDGERLYEVNY